MPNIRHHPSSAQSASSTSKEDWTKISDLAEKRRTQNRLAQRKYSGSLPSFHMTLSVANGCTGKKLKEQREPRAASLTESPHNPHHESGRTMLSQSGNRHRDEPLVTGTIGAFNNHHYQTTTSPACIDGQGKAQPQDARQLSDLWCRRRKHCAKHPPRIIMLNTPALLPRTMLLNNSSARPDSAANVDPRAHQAF